MSSQAEKNISLALEKSQKITATGRTFLYLVIALALAGMNTHTNLFHLLTGLLFSLWIVSPFLAKQNLSSLKISVDSPHEVFVDENFTLHYIVENHTNYNKFGLYFLDPTTENRFSVLQIEPLTRAEIPHDGQLRKRGKIKWKDILVATHFPFYFFSRNFSCSIDHEVLVLPKPLQISPSLNLVAPQNISESSESKMSSIKSIGNQFAGLREYTTGDSKKWIHWKATAKSNQLIVKEREQDVPLCMTMLVDTYMDSQNFSQKILEKTICAAASIASDMLHRGYQIDFHCGHHYISHGGGLQHLHKILRVLAEIEAVDEFPDFSNISGASVVISPFLDPQIKKDYVNCHSNYKTAIITSDQETMDLFSAYKINEITESTLTLEKV